MDRKMYIQIDRKAIKKKPTEIRVGKNLICIRVGDKLLKTFDNLDKILYHLEKQKEIWDYQAIGSVSILSTFSFGASSISLYILSSILDGIGKYALVSSSIISLLASGLSFKMYRDYKTVSDVIDVYRIVRTVNENSPILDLLLLDRSFLKKAKKYNKYLFEKEPMYKKILEKLFGPSDLILYAYNNEEYACFVRLKSYNNFKRAQL